MTRIRFEDLPSTNTPRNAENLNKLNNVIISSTEPTTGEEVWIDNVNKKIHTKTDNGYEEFYSEENREVYSTSEQRIGTWLGKPLYRKVLNLTTPDVTVFKRVSYEISDIETVVREDTYMIHNNKKYRIPYYEDSSYYCIGVFGNDGIYLYNSSSFLNKPIIIILEYTKTTD